MPCSPLSLGMLLKLWAIWRDSIPLSFSDDLIIKIMAAAIPMMDDMTITMNTKVRMMNLKSEWYMFSTYIWTTFFLFFLFFLF